MKNLPPQDLEAEKAFLGSIILDNDTMVTASSMVQEEQLYSENHRQIYRAMIALHDRHEPIDFVTLKAELVKSGDFERIGLNYLSDLCDANPTAANIKYHARLIVEAAQKRNILSTCRKTIENIDNDINDIMSEHHADMSRVTVSGGLTLNSVNPIIKRVLAQVEARSLNPDAYSGIPSGFKDLDLLTSGFQPGDLIIPAGRPSMGKTAIALSIARNAAPYVPIGIFSLEMTEDSLALRLLASESRTKLWNLKNGYVAKTEWSVIHRGVTRIAEMPIFFADRKARTLRALEQSIHSMCVSKNCGLIIIDYLQLIVNDSKGKTREREVSEISQMLKGAAVQYDIPIIALSQLSRAVESRENKRPILADLRDSGSIEQDADIVMFLYRDDYYDTDKRKSPFTGVVEINIAKGRNIGTGTVKLRWDAETQTFSDL